MIVKESTVTRIEITEAPRLDPIRVYLENYEPGKGRITISCYDAAWVGYWGGMSGDTIEAFLCRCDAGYLASNLSSAASLRAGKNHDAYLIRIIEAVQQALREHAKGGAA